MSTTDDRPSPVNDVASKIPTETDQLRERIRLAGLSQRAAARELGVDDRTMRYWCAGQDAPPRMALRALDPRVRHYEFMKETIRSNQQAIDLLESGKMTSGFGPELGTSQSAATEAKRLRRQNEELQSLVRLEEAFQRRQAAFFALNGQFLPHGDGLPTEECIAEYDAADAELRAAQSEIDGIAAEIRARRR